MITRRYTRKYDLIGMRLKESFGFLNELLEGTVMTNYKVVEYNFRPLDEVVFYQESDRYNILKQFLAEKGDIVAEDMCMDPDMTRGQWRIVYKKAIT